MNTKSFKYFTALMWLWLTSEMNALNWVYSKELNKLSSNHCQFKQNTNNNTFNTISGIYQQLCSDACKRNPACTHYYYFDEMCSLRKNRVNESEATHSKNNSVCGILTDRLGK